MMIPHKPNVPRLSVLMTGFSLLALTACGPGMKLNENFGVQLQGLSNSALMKTSADTVQDVEQTAETGDEQTVGETSSGTARVNPAEVCGIERPQINDGLSQQEREVLMLLTREEAIDRLIALAGEIEARLGDGKGPDVEKLQKELEEVRAALEKLESDSSYQAAFEKGRQILSERREGKALPALNLSEEQRECLTREIHKVICRDAEQALSTGRGPGGMELPEHVIESFRRFSEKNCQGAQ